MSALEEYWRWCEYTQPLSLAERGKAKAAIAEETARADRAEAALETANEHERQLIEVVAQHDRHAQDARNTAARRIRRARNETNAALDRAEKAEAENERLKVENLGLLRSFVGVVVNITATANEANETIKAQLARYEVKP